VRGPRFPGAVAIVTGGASGIGKATAERLAAEGAAIVLADRAGEQARAGAEQIEEAGGRAIASETDVTVGADVDAMVATAERSFGRVDILVNNAGGAVGEDLISTDEAIWDFDIDLCLKSVFFCSKRVLPSMIERRRGVIVNIVSVNALGGYGEDAYSAAKAGVLSLTRNVAVRYGGFGIRANAIAPGTIRTPVWRRRLELDPQVFEKLTKWYPLGRIGEPEDVADAVLFLASEEASWITGTLLVVDGGLTAGNAFVSGEIPSASDERR
jgi:NAD(P)-dependent dehydrogenase (short-subunit alcohol dehydrogenase family)